MYTFSSENLMISLSIITSVLKVYQNHILMQSAVYTTVLFLANLSFVYALIQPAAKTLYYQHCGRMIRDAFCVIDSLYHTF